jgi:hypothetical protein
MVEETNMCTCFVVGMLPVRSLYFGDGRRMLFSVHDLTSQYHVDGIS